MDTSDWFDFNNRVKQDETLVKEVNGQLVAKQVKGSFNWMAFLFNWIYVLATQRYKTRGFVKKALIIALVMWIAEIVVTIILGGTVGSLFAIVALIWYGLMFDTWFEHQLIANGYHVDNQVTLNSQDFE